MTIVTNGTVVTDVMVETGTVVTDVTVVTDGTGVTDVIQLQYYYVHHSIVAEDEYYNIK